MKSFCCRKLEWDERASACARTIPPPGEKGRFSMSMTPVAPVWRCLLFTGLAAAAVFASTAFAQVNQAASEWNVAERPRPAYDPAGLRSGGFMVYPSLELGVGNDDNIYRQPEGVRQDTKRSVRPRVFGVSQWRNHEVVLDAGLDASFFGDAEDENVTNWFAGAGGRLDVTRDAWVRAGLNFRELHEERGDPESPSTAVRPVSRQLAGVRIEAYRRVNHLNFRVEGALSDIAYDDAVDGVTGERLVQNDRNRSENELSVRVGWDMAVGYEAFARTTRYSRRYERPQGEDRYVRDSDGTEAVLGARLDLGTVLAGELFGGYRRQAYDSDDRLPEVEGVSYGASLTWNITPLTTIRSTGRRTVNESTLRQASGYLSSGLELDVDHELRRNLIVGAHVSMTANEYVGIARQDDIAMGIVRATWLVNRSVRAHMGYRAQRRDSTYQRDDYDKNFVYLDVRLSF